MPSRPHRRLCRRAATVDDADEIDLEAVHKTLTVEALRFERVQCVWRPRILDNEADRAEDIDSSESRRKRNGPTRCDGFIARPTLEARFYKTIRRNNINTVNMLINSCRWATGSAEAARGNF